MRPERQHPEGARSRLPDGYDVAASVWTLAWSRVVHAHVHDRAYVPANLAGAAALVALAGAAGVGRVELGVEPARMGRGLRWGALGAAAVGAAVAGALAHPRSRAFFEGDHDERPGSVSYHLALRIPIGTALAEELMFRGALQGILARGRPPWHAAAASSVLFGLWHVWPTRQSLDRNRAAGTVVDGPARRAGAVASTVAATTAAGLGLSYLKLKSRSLLAPVVAHAAVNALGYLGGRLAAGSGATGSDSHDRSAMVDQFTSTV